MSAIARPLGARRPRLDWPRCGLVDSVERRQRAGDDHVPAPMVLVADLVELERRTHSAEGSRPQRAVGGAHHDSPVVDREVDRSHRGSRLAGHGDPAHPTTLEKTHAVSSTQDREATGVPLSSNCTTSLRSAGDQLVTGQGIVDRGFDRHDSVRFVGGCCCCFPSRSRSRMRPSIGVCEAILWATSCSVPRSIVRGSRRHSVLWSARRASPSVAGL